MHPVADAVVNRPSTGRLIAGMILDGVDVAALKDDFPLLERLAKNGEATSAAMTYALAPGWEVFGSSLIAALDTSPDPNEVVEALNTAMNVIQATDDSHQAPQPPPENQLDGEHSQGGPESFTGGPKAHT
jgi:hypothetical protein